MDDLLRDFLTETNENLGVLDTEIVLPDGAEVLIDETSVGVGPLAPVEVEPGEHAIRVRLQGYSEYTDVDTVGRGAEVHVPVDLIPLAHVLAVSTTPPGARLFVVDRFAGETPTDVESRPKLSRYCHANANTARTHTLTEWHATQRDRKRHVA
jgi:hypothetical protein